MNQNWKKRKKERAETIKKNKAELQKIERPEDKISRRSKDVSFSGNLIRRSKNLKNRNQKTQTTLK